MEHPSGPLNLCHVHTKSVIINRAHMLIHAAALSALLYYRASFLFREHDSRNKATTLAWRIISVAELILSFLWLLDQAYRWRPVSRTAFPERLPEDEKLPAIDVFVCTADPDKEPTVDVMNTVVSAMALDYPPEKLHVYLSDDAGSPLTLHGMREAYDFARWWLPFCKRYGIKTRCPKAYFREEEDDEGIGMSYGSEFGSEKQKVKEKYELFEERVIEYQKRHRSDSSHSGRDHPSTIEVVRGNLTDEVVQADQVPMPQLVYVSREKRPSHHHHFKAGALNVLLRVSGVISNSPYILVLDCDMHCNDPSSARQAMCFHLDPRLSPSLTLVQFPQRFRGISENDIYDSKHRWAYWVWHGMDGLKGPVLSGSCFYIRRKSLYRKSIQEGFGLEDSKKVFGHSNEFIKYLWRNGKPSKNSIAGDSAALWKETQVLASCGYEDDTEWGQQVGFMYYSVAEDYFTGFTLHCKGWRSVYYNPSRPQFLGTATTNLNDLLIQGTRWSSGLSHAGVSRFCPLIYGTWRMPILQSMCYAQLALWPFYCLPICCFATIPQICLVNGISIYPEVSSSYMMLFAFNFLSSLCKHLYEVLASGHSVQTFLNEQRMWMIKSTTCHVYGTMDGIMTQTGMRRASFLPTNKVDDDEQARRYEMGIFDFQTSVMFLAPMVTLVILNTASFVGGLARVLISGGWEELFLQIVLSLFVLVMSYPVIEGMALRTDKGRIPPSVTIQSAILSLALLLLGSSFLM
ncbi:cellulose synthase A catalytic subunit 7 [UDP-forming]-like [Rhodamnia argentea]|uniref:Cellulose synthase A catalytic subunit 7 [UDP-forming]-like n=1 Tax=Rhodamnia argentea TaxID=178133 RepID=A0ABM3H2U5_9MYRT|nr:cellulose synthase A catalytic subunit 7 [UDP-forming]-like [Rhodamnia argentea]